MTNFGFKMTILVASFGAVACSTDVNDEPSNTPPPGSTSGDESTTFDHENDGYSPWELIDRLAKEGPPRYTSKVHSCPKVRYATLGNVLKSLGVNTANATQLSAGQLYTSGFNAMGGASYANRVRENISVTTSGASREFDIFAAAAPEIITAMPTLARCNGAAMFDASNQCRADGITCLIGQPALPAHLDFCNLTVTSASDVTVGKNIAVAAILAAAYTCE
ncbi:MAG TPA: hypothetical protein VL856_04970 [Acidimicrobiia bacterium]|jgi:hypothetical protein|nr:hypothetical protein [Acidimicrobiia bacterium]